MSATPDWRILASLAFTLFSLSCARTEPSTQREKDAQTPAGKVGQLAYQAAKESGKVAKSAAKEASKAAHEAHEGWKDAAAKDKSKH